MSDILRTHKIPMYAHIHIMRTHLHASNSNGFRSSVCVNVLFRIFLFAVVKYHCCDDAFATQRPTAEERMTCSLSAMVRWLVAHIGWMLAYKSVAYKKKVHAAISKIAICELNAAQKICNTLVITRVYTYV